MHPHGKHGSSPAGGGGERGLTGLISAGPGAAGEVFWVAVRTTSQWVLRRQRLKQGSEMLGVGGGPRECCDIRRRNAKGVIGMSRGGCWRWRVLGCCRLQWVLAESLDRWRFSACWGGLRMVLVSSRRWVGGLRGNWAPVGAGDCTEAPGGSRRAAGSDRRRGLGAARAAPPGGAGPSRKQEAAARPLGPPPPRAGGARSRAAERDSRRVRQGAAGGVGSGVPGALRQGPCAGRAGPQPPPVVVARAGWRGLPWA